MSPGQAGRCAGCGAGSSALTGPAFSCRRVAPFLDQRAAPARRPARRGELHVPCAKKKGKKGGQKKGPGSLMDLPQAPAPAEELALEPWQGTDAVMTNLLLVESHSRNVGRPLLPGEVELEDISTALWEAPFALLAHEAPAPDQPPVFTYANKVALELFEAEWGELVGQPSSVSADDDAQADRSEALGKALEGGKLEGYSGWRRSLKGTRFRIVDATLFNVSSPTGEVVGQAVTIGQWCYEDGRIEGPDADPGSSVPGPDDVTAAEHAVEEQAEAVRALKEGEGLTNSDPAVKAAVEELLGRKAKLQKLHERLAAAGQAPPEPSNA